MAKSPPPGRNTQFSRLCSGFLSGNKSVAIQHILSLTLIRRKLCPMGSPTNMYFGGLGSWTISLALVLLSLPSFNFAFETMYRRKNITKLRGYNHHLYCNIQHQFPTPASTQRWTIEVLETDNTDYC